MCSERLFVGTNSVKQESESTFTDHVEKNKESTEYYPPSSIKIENVTSLYEHVDIQPGKVLHNCFFTALFVNIKCSSQLIN